MFVVFVVCNKCVPFFKMLQSVKYINLSPKKTLAFATYSWSMTISNMNVLLQVWFSIKQKYFFDTQQISLSALIKSYFLLN